MDNEKEMGSLEVVEALRQKPGHVRRKPIGVLLCLEPRLLREMTRLALSRVPDIRIVGACLAPERIQTIIDEENVNWVIVNTIDEESPLDEETLVLLNNNPSISLLGIALDGGLLKTWWIGLHEEIIQKPTLEDIVAVLHRNFAQG